MTQALHVAPAEVAAAHAPSKLQQQQQEQLPVERNDEDRAPDQAPADCSAPERPRAAARGGVAEATALAHPAAVMDPAVAADAATDARGESTTQLTFSWAGEPSPRGAHLHYTSFSFCDTPYAVCTCGGRGALTPAQSIRPLSPSHATPCALGAPLAGRLATLFT